MNEPRKQKKRQRQSMPQWMAELMDNIVADQIGIIDAANIAGMMTDNLDELDLLIEISATANRTRKLIIDARNRVKIESLRSDK